MVCQGRIMFNSIKGISNKKYLLLILMIYTILSGLLLNTDLPIVDEEPYYFLLSQSIISGEGYRNVFYPDNPVNVEYPPLYPLFISLILFVSPYAILGLRILSFFFGAGSLIVFYFFVFSELPGPGGIKNRKLTRNCFLVMLLFITINPLFLSYSVRILAEKCYLFFSLITVFMLEKYITRDNSNKLYLGIGTISLIFAFYTKTLGLSLVLAVGLYFFIKRKYRDILLIGSVFGLSVLPWIVRNILVSGVPSEYVGSIISGHKVYSVNIFQLILFNIIHYGQSIKYVFFPGCFLSKLIWYFPSLFSLMNIEDYFNFPFPGMCSVFMGGILVFGFYLDTRNKFSLMTAYTLFFFSMLLLCPPDFFLRDGNKYLYQILPFLSYYFISGFFGIGRKINFLHFIAKKIIVGIFILILIIPNLICDFYLIRGNINCLANTKKLSKEEKIDYYAPWFNVYFMTASWVKEKLPLDACIMHNVPYTFYLYSKHKTISLYLDRKEKNLEAIIEENAGYIAVGTQEEEKLVEELNKITDEYVFIPLVLFIRRVGKNKLSGFSKVYKIIKVDSRVKQLYQEGSYFYNREDYKQAILKFKRALQISPDLIGYYNLGIIYEKRGMVKEAIQMYRETLKIEPNFQIVENRLNVLCQREFIKQNTRDFEGYKKLGEYYFKNYDYPEAIGAYTECLEINDKLKLRDNDRKIVDISSVYYNLGKAYFSQGDYDKAAGEFRKALKMNPQVKYRVKHYMKLIDRLKN